MMFFDEIVPYGKHKDKKWSEVPKSYLEYVANGLPATEFTKMCIDELRRRNAKVKRIHVTNQAIDSASFVLIDKWQKAILAGSYSNGFYSYVVAHALYVLDNVDHDNSGKVYFKDLIFVFEFGSLYPTLLGVQRIKTE